ncbi:hypothetical protein K435DRAFT_793704 [Dendrothele bispora CBS 962.96]|uniref:Uncharacterized protein n=1 Tax=Dendrothele bispora (strain CBS 962.96) TaxID=1314807 RepID=A0A4S8MEH3_DENBC|nr:hypothetical protein K435DRAFT_793704 [Dendrothele bispora CBS 962.96]
MQAFEVEPAQKKTTHHNNTNISHFAKDFYNRKLNNPKEFLRYWSGNITTLKLKKQREKSKQIIKCYLFFLKWGKDPNPHYSTFIPNIWSRLDFDNLPGTIPPGRKKYSLGFCSYLAPITSGDDSLWPAPG